QAQRVGEQRVAVLGLQRADQVLVVRHGRVASVVGCLIGPGSLIRAGLQRRACTLRSTDPDAGWFRPYVSRSRRVPLLLAASAPASCVALIGPVFPGPGSPAPAAPRRRARWPAGARG